MSNQVALITGGATGIGKAVALKLIRQGVSVVISGRRQEMSSAAIAEIAALAHNGAQVRFIQNDVSDEAVVKGYDRSDRRVGCRKTVEGHGTGAGDPTRPTHIPTSCDRPRPFNGLPDIVSLYTLALTGLPWTAPLRGCANRRGIFSESPPLSNVDRYTRTAIVLHWANVLLATVQFSWGWWMQGIAKIPQGPPADAFNLHKSVGLTILC